MISEWEFDPAGAQVHPIIEYGGGGDPPPPREFGSPEALDTGCVLDGINIPCGWAMQKVNGGAAAFAPAETTRYNHERGAFEFFRAYADGTTDWDVLNPYATEVVPGVPLIRHNEDGSTTTTYSGGPQRRRRQARGDRRRRQDRHPVLYPNITSNCFRNMVIDSPGLGQSFRVLGTGDNTYVDHDGDHIRAPLGEPGIVVVVPVLNGARVLKIGGLEGGLHYMDVRLSTGDVAVFKDLTRTPYREGETLVGGSVLAYTRPGTTSTITNVGLHLTIVRSELYDRRRNGYRELTRRIAALRANDGPISPPLVRELRPHYFIRLDDDESPFRCR